MGQAFPQLALRVAFEPRELGYSFDPGQVVLREGRGGEWRARGGRAWPGHGAEGDITDYLVMTEGHTELIAKALYTEFLLPFEIASILLLVAIVGAVVLAKKDV